jgi:hypothetical protein
MNKKGFILAVVLIAIFAVYGEITLACGGAPSDYLKTKAEYSFFETAYNDAEAVFIGKVIELDRYKLKLQVYKVWKGKPANELIMSTSIIKLESGLEMVSSCIYNFEKGKSYLIFAKKSNFSQSILDTKPLNGQDHLLVTYKDGFTRTLEEAKQGIINLNRIKKPKTIKQDTKSTQRF